MVAEFPQSPAARRTALALALFLLTVCLLAAWSFKKTERQMEAEIAEDALTAEACTILKSEAAAQTAFPGAVEYLCTKPSGPDPGCGSRSIQFCTTDSRCAHEYYSCQSGVCRSCEPIHKPKLANLVRHFQFCKRSGGSWVDAKIEHRYGGACSCNEGNQEKANHKFYAGERGCVLEKTLCEEKGGSWKIPEIPQSPNVEQRLASCKRESKNSSCIVDIPAFDPPSVSVQPFCEIAGVRVHGETLRPDDFESYSIAE